MISTAYTTEIIIISPQPDIDNYNYNYYITENECECVYFSSLLVFVDVVLHTFLWKWRGA
jgi:hypothetical protein